MEELLDLTFHVGSLVSWPGLAVPEAMTAGAVPAAIRVDLVTEPEDFDRLLGEHRELEREAAFRPTPFQTHAFLGAWARCYAPNAPLRVLTLRRHDKLIFSLPLVERSTPFGRVAEIAGRPLAQYSDAVMAAPVPETWLRCALYHLRAEFGISAVLFHNVRHDAALAPWLRGNGRRVGTADAAPGLSLGSVRSAGVGGTHQSLDKRNRRTMRRLEKAGRVDFAIVGPGDEAVALLHEAIAMKEDWLRERGLAGRAFADAQAVKCLEDLVGEGNSGAVVSCLSLDGRPIAIEIGFSHRRHYCAYLGAFSSELSRYGVGKLQIQRTIEELVEQGAETYDLLPPGDDYKHDWADHSVEVCDYEVLLAPSGALASAWRMRLPRIAKAAFERLPRPVRSRLRGFAR